MNSQLSLEAKEIKQADEQGLDRFECITKFSEHENHWKIQRKTKADFVLQRKQKDARRATILKEKNKIEFVALQEGFRTILKQKTANEWLAARQRNPEWMKKTQSESVDMKVIEAEMDIAIMKSLEEVLKVARLEEQEAEKKEEGEEPVEGEQAPEEAKEKPKKLKKLTFLQMIRRDSLLESSVRQFYKPPSTKRASIFKPGE